MSYETYKTRLFHRLTDTCATLPNAALMVAFRKLSGAHAQLLLSLLPMKTIGRLSYVMDPDELQNLPTDDLPDHRATELATEILAFLNDLTVNEASQEAPEPSPTPEQVTSSMKVLDFIARRMGRLTIKS